MSIFVKFGEPKKNTNRPWNLDMGSIIHINNEGIRNRVTRVIGRFRPIDENGQTDLNGQPDWYWLWPNRDPYRFGLYYAKDENYGHPLYKSERYPDLEEFDDSVFYPHKNTEITPEMKHGYESYVIYTDPQECTLKFYIRSCNYRYNRRYQCNYLTYELNEDMTENAPEGIRGGFLSEAKFTFYDESRYIYTDDETDNLDDLSDIIFTVKQSTNTSLYDNREATITLRQYDQYEQRYTGKMIFIRIIQLKNRLLANQLRYALSWYTDEDCTIQTDEYPWADYTGDNITVYFKVTGVGATWAGPQAEFYFMEWDYLNESINQLAMVMNPSTTHWIPGPIISNDLGRFACTIKVGENIPDISNKDKPYIPEEKFIAIPIDATNTHGYGRFQIWCTFTTDINSIIVQVKLNNVAFSNTVTLWQDGHVTNVNITDDYCKSAGYSISSSNINPANSIYNIKFSHTDGDDWIKIEITLSDVNVTMPDYKLQNVAFDSYQNISEDGGTVNLTWDIIKLEYDGEAQYYSFLISLKSNVYNNLSYEAFFEHSAYHPEVYQAKLTGYTADIITFDVISDFEDIEYGDLTNIEGTYHYPITIPENSVPDDPTFAITDFGHYILENGVYSLTAERLNGEAPESGNLYFGFRLILTAENSQARRISFELRIKTCEENIVDLRSNINIMQNGMILNQYENVISSESSKFRLRNTTDDITVDNVGIYSEKDKRYYIQAVYESNSSNIIASSKSYSAPYTITETKNYGWSDSNNGSLLYFKISSTTTYLTDTRDVTFSISSLTDTSVKITDNWLQDQHTVSGGIEQLTTDALGALIASNQIAIELNQTNNADLFVTDKSTVLFALLNEVSLISKGTNDTFHNYQTRLSFNGEAYQPVNTGTPVTKQLYIWESGSISFDVDTRTFNIDTIASGYRYLNPMSDANAIYDIKISYDNASLSIPNGATLKYTGEQYEEYLNSANIKWTSASSITGITFGNTMYENNIDGGQNALRTITGTANSGAARQTSGIIQSDNTKLTVNIRQQGNTTSYIFNAQDNYWLVTNNITGAQSHTFNITSKTSTGTNVTYTYSISIPTEYYSIMNGNISFSTSTNTVTVNKIDWSINKWQGPFDVKITLTQTSSGYTETLIIAFPDFIPVTNNYFDIGFNKTDGVASITVSQNGVYKGTYKSTSTSILKANIGDVIRWSTVADTGYNLVSASGWHAVEGEETVTGAHTIEPYAEQVHTVTFIFTNTTNINSVTVYGAASKTITSTDNTVTVKHGGQIGYYANATTGYTVPFNPGSPQTINSDKTITVGSAVLKSYVITFNFPTAGVTSVNVTSPRSVQLTPSDNIMAVSHGSTLAFTATATLGYTTPYCIPSSPLTITEGTSITVYSGSEIMCAVSFVINSGVGSVTLYVNGSNIGKITSDSSGNIINVKYGSVVSFSISVKSGYSVATSSPSSPVTVTSDITITITAS